MHKLCLSQIFRGFQARRKVWFTFFKAKRREERRDSGCDQL